MKDHGVVPMASTVEFHVYRHPVLCPYLNIKTFSLPPSKSTSFPSAEKVCEW